MIPCRPLRAICSTRYQTCFGYMEIGRQLPYLLYYLFVYELY